ncbi:hypothetical protein EFR84_19000 [Rhizobium chutanense]|uniref:Uncharacterized protein n=1 Tax=Rhizobium chutanense TaxID=2035448 RepID=A0A3S0QW52_9HYPH|nr:hypothetical protein EFR84_19000 [Rhizobium chutanense]
MVFATTFFLAAGVVCVAGATVLAGSSLANSVLPPGSKIQLCRIAPEPARKVEQSRTRMMSFLVMWGAPGSPF